MITAKVMLNKSNEILCMLKKGEIKSFLLKFLIKILCLFVSSLKLRRQGYRDPAQSPLETSIPALAHTDSLTRLSTRLPPKNCTHLQAAFIIPPPFLLIYTSFIFTSHILLCNFVSSSPSFFVHHPLGSHLPCSLIVSPPLL